MPHPSRLLSVLLVLLCTGTACAVDEEDAPVGLPLSSLAASKLAVLAVGVATAPEGGGFLDNFLPCPRRGVIDYRNSNRGRVATFNGCDAGDGVVVDGTAEVQWTQLGGDRGRITAITVVGPLYVRPTDGRSALDRVERVDVSGIGFATSESPTVQALVVSPVRVTVAGVTTPLHALATPAHVFAPALAIDAIPNPANSLAELTEVDVRRIAFHGGVALASILINETLEIQRGAHVHTEPCGTMRVTPDVARNLPHLEMSWTGCDARHGLLQSGTFTADWAEFDFDGGRIAMVVDGALTMGGGVPTVTLSRLEWTVTGLGDLPRTIRIAGRLVSGTQVRAYSFDVVVDD